MQRLIAEVELFKKAGLVHPFAGSVPATEPTLPTANGRSGKLFPNNGVKANGEKNKRYNR